MVKCYILMELKGMFLHRIMINKKFKMPTNLNSLVLFTSKDENWRIREPWQLWHRFLLK
jgi:hypothetical protein